MAVRGRNGAGTGVTFAALVVLAGVLQAPAAVAAAPKLEHLVAYKSGRVVQKQVRAPARTVRVAGRRCAVAEGTALAALLRSRPGRVGLRDFGDCSRRARDGGGLFVRAISGERNRGQDGWTYKVGTRAATAGAADPSGPFGNGRLRSAKRVTWFYCRLRRGSCQRTLGMKLERGADGTVAAVVRGYDDEGRSVPVGNATVTAGATRVATDARGRTPPFDPGGDAVRARKRGLVPSFAERAPAR